MGLSSDLGQLRRFRPSTNQGPSKTESSSLKEWNTQSYTPETEKPWDALDLSEPVQVVNAPLKSVQEEKAAPHQIISGKVLDVSVKPEAWALELAKQEARMDRDQTVDFHNSFRKGELLKHKTAEYICELQRAFREQTEIFNSKRASAAHQIHIYKVSRTDYDFMLFRNGVKLVISAQQSGRILFAFNQYLGELFAPGRKPVFEIQAQWGVLDQLYWTYKSERLGHEDLLRFFFTEFVRQSYR